MLRKLKMYLVAAVLMWAAFLFPERGYVEAATSETEPVVSTVTGSASFTPILYSDGISVSGSSGVTELDNAAKKTNTLINWICGWLGGIMALFGFIWAAMNQAGHNTESRNMGIIVAVVGVVIAFAPKIVNFILG